MNGREFISRVRNMAKARSVPCRFDRTRGKGSHGTLYFGDRRTTVKDRGKEISTGLLRAMCRQLGMDPRDL